MSGPGSGAPDGADSPLPPGWAGLAPLIDAVLDAAPEERAALIVRLCGGDRARERALTHLVAECERDTPLLEGVASERFGGLAELGEPSLLPELLGDRYRTGRELGRGGMARVYLARDLKHGRDVAIKVIRPELSASLGHDRFLREIEIAARLRHPNIVPLYDSGEVGGSLYFVMPFEEGRSLRDRLCEEGALPMTDALSVLRDMARALAYAHEHGVVHRDVKPDNVMLSGDAAVVTDFGIAKAVSVALTEVSGPTLTQSGSAIGTPAYMAPEQATGDPSIDHRADIYSFGCVAYELLTGKPPFHDQPMHQIIAGHIATVPGLVNTIRADVPPPLAALVARCLEKDPADRPQTARDVLGALDVAATTGSGTLAVRSEPQARRTLLRAGAVLATVGLVATAYFAVRPAAGGSAPISLSVLPFGNIGADSALEYVAEGLADELAGELARVPGIQIKSRSGARAYRGQLGPDVTEAGSRLKADYLITGVVRQERGRWILSAELARAADKASLWGDNFNLGAEEQAGTAEAIAGTLVKAMQGLFPKSIGTPTALASNQRTSNPEAYRLYLRGQEKLDRRGQSVEESATLFRGAIHQDSLFARAFSGLSMALALFPYFQGVPAKDIYDDVVGAAHRALELDSTLAQPHVALGLVYQFNYQWERAATEYQTAVRLDGRNVEARVQYARNLLLRGRHSEALLQLRAARSEDPASALVLSWLSYGYFLEGQTDSALAESERALENDPANFSTAGLRSMILVDGKHPEAARALLDRLPPWHRLYVVAKTGDRDAARRGLQEMDAQTPPPWLVEARRAFAYLGLGDTAKALSALERATEGQEPWPTLFGVTDPVYRSIRGSPRFQVLLRRVGLRP